MNMTLNSWLEDAWWIVMTLGQTAMLLKRLFPRTRIYEMTKNAHASHADEFSTS
jgi:hypothetical protein